MFVFCLGSLQYHLSNITSAIFEKKFVLLPMLLYCSYNNVDACFFVVWEQIAWFSCKDTTFQVSNREKYFASILFINILFKIIFKVIFWYPRRCWCCSVWVVSPLIFDYHKKTVLSEMLHIHIGGGLCWGLCGPYLRYSGQLPRNEQGTSYLKHAIDIKMLKRQYS